MNIILLKMCLLSMFMLSCTKCLIGERDRDSQRHVRCIIRQEGIILARKNIYISQSFGQSLERLIFTRIGWRVAGNSRLPSSVDSEEDVFRRNLKAVVGRPGGGCFHSCFVLIRESSKTKFFAQLYSKETKPYQGRNFFYLKKINFDLDQSWCTWATPSW